MSSGNVRLHPFNSGAAAIVRACPEREQRVEWETSHTVILGPNLKLLARAERWLTRCRRADNPHLPLRDFLSLARERSKVRVEPYRKIIAA
jgi:hypothetical protein